MAPVGRRLGALFIDWAIAVLIAYGLLADGDPRVANNWALALFLVMSLLTVGTVGSTPGKRLCGLRVVAVDGLGRLVCGAWPSVRCCWCGRPRADLGPRRPRSARPALGRGAGTDLAVLAAAANAEIGVRAGTHTGFARPGAVVASSAEYEQQVLVLVVPHRLQTLKSDPLQQPYGSGVPDVGIGVERAGILGFDEGTHRRRADATAPVLPSEPVPDEAPVPSHQATMCPAGAPSTVTVCTKPEASARICVLQ